MTKFTQCDCETKCSINFLIFLSLSLSPSLSICKKKSASAAFVTTKYLHLKLNDIYECKEVKINIIIQ